MTLTVQRRFVTPMPEETVEALAARAMPGELFLFHNRLETGADI